MTQNAGSASSVRERYVTLPTERELQVLEHLAAGATLAEAARALGISPRTVKTYMDRLHERLRVRSAAQAVAIAIRMGWIA